jgi:hypothetical protein
MYVGYGRYNKFGTNLSINYSCVLNVNNRLVRPLSILVLRALVMVGFRKHGIFQDCSLGGYRLVTVQLHSRLNTNRGNHFVFGAKEIALNGACPCFVSKSSTDVGHGGNNNRVDHD